MLDTFTDDISFSLFMVNLLSFTGTGYMITSIEVISDGLLFWDATDLIAAVSLCE
jgi:hypothetical protein